MTSQLPDDAITAAVELAQEADQRYIRNKPAPKGNWQRVPDEQVRRLLTAALPALTGAITSQAAAAERAKWPTFAEPVALRRCANQLALQDAPIAVTETLFQLADLLAGTADGAHTPGGAT